MTFWHSKSLEGKFCFENCDILITVEISIKIPRWYISTKSRIHASTHSRQLISSFHQFKCVCGIELKIANIFQYNIQESSFVVFDVVCWWFIHKNVIYTPTKISRSISKKLMRKLPGLQNAAGRHNWSIITELWKFLFCLLRCTTYMKHPTYGGPLYNKYDIC